MKIHELMTEDVLTIGPEAPVKDVARILVENGISGLPVCDIEGHVVGVISEGDILFKEHDPTDGARPRARLARRRRPRQRSARQVEGDGRAQRDDVSCDHDRPARVGRPGRADDVRAPRQPAPGREEREARRHRHPRRSRSRVHSHGRADRDRAAGGRARTARCGSSPARSRSPSSGAHVELTGRLPMRSEAEMLARLAARVPGVISVTSTVLWNFDDTTRKGKRELANTAV